MAIVGLIMGPLTASIIVGFNAVNASSAALNQSADAQLVEIYLPRDVQSATTTQHSQCGISAVLTLDWGAVLVSGSPPTTVSQPNEVDYLLEPAPGSTTTQHLVRDYYVACSLENSTIVAYDLSLRLGAAAAVPTFPTATSVNLTLTDVAGTSYSVSAQERTP